MSQRSPKRQPVAHGRPPAADDEPEGFDDTWGVSIGWSVGRALRTAPAFQTARQWQPAADQLPFRVACLGYRQPPSAAAAGPDLLTVDDALVLATGIDRDDDLDMLTDPGRAADYIRPLAAAAPEIRCWAILLHAVAPSGRRRQSLWLLTSAGQVITSLHHTGTWLELADMLAPAEPRPPAPAVDKSAVARHHGPFGDGRASILSAREFQAALAAMQQSDHPGLWRVVGDVAVYRERGDVGGYVDVQRRGAGSTPDAVLAELARAGGDALSDTYASITARYIAAGAPAQGLWINVNDILRDRGIVQLPAGGHRTEDRLGVGRHLAELTNWRLSSRLPAWDGKAATRRRPITIESSLLTVTDTVLQTGTAGERVPLAVRCSLGDYARYFLTNGAGRQTCLLMQAALRYDPTHERTQKRLAYHFAFRFRLVAEARELPPPMTVASLFQDAHVAVDGPTQRANPARTIQRWVAALNDLRRDGVVAEYELLASGGEARRGKLDRWLSQHIRVGPPTHLLTQHDEITDPEPRSARAEPAG